MDSVLAPMEACGQNCARGPISPRQRSVEEYQKVFLDLAAQLSSCFLQLPPSVQAQLSLSKHRYLGLENQIRRNGKADAEFS